MSNSSEGMDLDREAKRLVEALREVDSDIWSILEFIESEGPAARSKVNTLRLRGLIRSILAAVQRIEAC